MFNSTEIAKLQTRIAELEGISTEATASIAGLKASLAESSSTIAAHVATIGELNAKVEAAEAAIQSEVTNRLAAAGIDPIARAAAVETQNLLTRAEFGKLSAKAKAAFCTSGGVIV
jgi:hypothetical protein